MTDYITLKIKRSDASAIGNYLLAFARLLDNDEDVYKMGQEMFKCVDEGIKSIE